MMKLLAFGAVAALFTTLGCTAETNNGNDGSSPSKAAYLAAKQKAADCTRAKGWVVGSLEPNTDKVTYSFSISSPSSKDFPDEEQARALKDYDACMYEFVDSTGIAEKYLDSLKLSGAEWEANYAEMIRCLEVAGVSGVKIGDKVGEVNEKIPEDNSDARRCLTEHDWQLFGNNAE